MNAVELKKNGGPEVLEIIEKETPAPGSDQLLIKQKAIGINFIDIYQRNGLYPVDLPFTPGFEGSGIIEKAGYGVEDFIPGERVAYAAAAKTYAEYTVVDTENAVKIPDKLSFESAAALMLQGMTAHYLAKSTYHISENDRVLIHAGAGGVGRLLIQLAKSAGAEVFTTVSTKEKSQIAAACGADHVILYTMKDFRAEIERIAGKRALSVVYDSVGKATFLNSMACLRPRGYLVSFGQSSGKVDPVDPGLLSSSGSLFLTRPTLFHYIADRESLVNRAGEMFQLLLEKKISLLIGETFPLSKVREAQSLLESRKSVGKILLIP